MRLSAILGLYVAMAAPSAHSACAQTADSLPFHRGQWGADFLIGSGFGSTFSGAGALHFSSPWRAQVLDLTSTFAHASESAGTTTNTANTTGTAIRLGLRAYHPLDPRVVRWTTFGVSLNYNWRRTTQDTLTTTTQALGAGAFANLGASWLVTPHLSIGAFWEATVTYVHNRAGGYGGSLSSDQTSLSLSRVALTGQLYF